MAAAAVAVAEAAEAQVQAKNGAYAEMEADSFVEGIHETCWTDSSSDGSPYCRRVEQCSGFEHTLDQQIVSYQTDDAGKELE